MQCRGWKSTCTLPPPKSANTKLPAPNSADWGTTKCTECCTSSARKISTNGWRRGRRRNNNGEHGDSSCTRGPARVHSQIYLQPGPQGYRHSVLLSGVDGGVCRDVPLAADAGAHDLADRGAAPGGRDQAGDLSQPAYHARHYHGVFRAHYGAAGRVWKLLSADSDRSARY